MAVSRQCDQRFTAWLNKTGLSNGEVNIEEKNTFLVFSYPEEGRTSTRKRRANSCPPSMTLEISTYLCVDEKEEYYDQTAEMSTLAPTPNRQISSQSCQSSDDMSMYSGSGFQRQLSFQSEDTAQALEGTTLWDLSDDITTVMMKNIPCRCTKLEVLEVIEEMGCMQEGDLQFFYMPVKRGGRLNYGYAFVDLKDPQAALTFATNMAGIRFPRRRSEKELMLSPAKLQGFAQNAEHFENTKVVRTASSPLFWWPQEAGLQLRDTDERVQ
eukprot:gnl/TRDRNA2_/TRDRNA2_29564_c0_seq1.p1 gnl/TRDRNA2_/TRDRNA2_29564_c0~~gnl/TRDRNA2_/TRDRNA2_29564_c0_seq1.p1  ORF type:complete len:269 (+),score=61.65 gnl/TRDRNA2_/TRDRNA2_29564_c0_seq1:55-861(+)